MHIDNYTTMTTLFRLLKFVRCLNASSPKTRLIAVNFENLSVDALLNPRAVFFANGYKNYVSAADAEPNISCQDMDIDQKMTLLNKEISRYGRITKFNIDDILTDIQKSETVTSMQGLFLLRCCTELIADKSPSLRKELGEEIWRTLKKLGVELDVSHYNVLLSIYLENECDFSPLDFLEDMLNENVKPNRVTFQRLIQQFCNQGKITEANQLVEHMNNYQIPVNEEILTSFIWGHTMNNNMDAAHAILKHMESLEIKPTIRTYSTLMYSYAINGDIDSIRKILADCKDKDIWVPDKVLLKVVYHLSLNGFTEFVDEILSMTSKGTLYIKEANQMMYKLVEKQQENIAFKIFQTLPKDAMNQAVTSGNFFIQTLINFQTPIEKSVEYCRIMTEEGINQRSFLSAINKSLANDMYDSSITFMKAWKDLGGQVREHYFYPIFKAYGETGQWEGIEKVLHKMTLEFDLLPSIYTLKSHILPYMQSSADDVLASFINAHVEYHVALNAILMHLLSENKIREASKFLTTYSSLCKMGMIKYNLLQAFKNTEDAPSFVSILHLIYKAALHEKNNTQYTTMENKYLAQQFIDSCITEAIDFISPTDKYLLLMFFRTLVDKGLSISPKIAIEVENKLKDHITKEIADALNIMKSGDLVPKPIFRDFSAPRIKKYTDIEKLESFAKVLTITNSKAAMGLKKSLLISYCDALNEQKVEEILEEFEMNNINMTTWTYMSLITMYLNLQKTDKAEFWLCKCKKFNPTFKLHQDMNLKLVTALIENGEIEKAQEYLKWPTWLSRFSMLYACRKLLDSVSKRNDAELLQKFFDLLKENGYTTNMHDTLFSSFIQFYLARNDPATALQKFEWLYKTYKKAPCRVELMKIFIKNGDNDSLERLKTICKSIMGETETSFHVAMAYLENNDLKTTKNIIKNDCAELYEENVIYFADNYYQNGQIDYLERLFEVLNTLKFDVERLCVLLLKSYSMQKEWKKGYNLWMRMQKDDIKPSNSFINCLNLILKEKNELGNDSFQKFNIALRNNDYEAAKECLNSLPLVYKSDCYSLLCKKYNARNNMAQVMDLWQELVQKWHLELDLNVAEHVLTKLVKEKDISSIEKIGSYLSTTCKRQLKYNYHLNQAYLQTGSWNVYLKKLETKLANASLTWRSLEFHNKTVVYSLIKYPELTQQFEYLAYNFTEKKIWAPVHALWIYYFLEKNPKADKVWMKYIKSGSSSYWLDVLDFSQCKNNADAHLKIADLLRESGIRKNRKFTTYSKIIRECINLDNPKKYEYGLRCLKSAMQEFTMEEFDVNLLADLQTGLENSGIPWPWTAKLDNMDDKVRERMLKSLLL